MRAYASTHHFRVARLRLRRCVIFAVAAAAVAARLRGVCGGDDVALHVSGAARGHAQLVQQALVRGCAGRHGRGTRTQLRRRMRESRDSAAEERAVAAW